jgi:hypothetical protein
MTTETTPPTRVQKSWGYVERGEYDADVRAHTFSLNSDGHWGRESEPIFLIDEAVPLILAIMQINGIDVATIDAVSGGAYRQQIERETIDDLADTFAEYASECETLPARERWQWVADQVRAQQPQDGGER